MNRGPVAVQVRPVTVSVEQASTACDTLETAVPPQVRAGKQGIGQASCGATSSQSYLRHPPPDGIHSSRIQSGWAMRDGTGETESTPTSSSAGLQDRGSKGRSATVDCCSSDLSVPDGKQGTISARGTSVSSPFRVYDARIVTSARKPSSSSA